MFYYTQGYTWLFGQGSGTGGERFGQLFVYVKEDMGIPLRQAIVCRVSLVGLHFDCILWRQLFASNLKEDCWPLHADFWTVKLIMISL